MGFVRRHLVVDPGTSREVRETDWRGALVCVTSGELELETSSGARRRFVAGDVLWLSGLSVRLVRNLGPGPAVLTATSRT